MFSTDTNNTPIERIRNNIVLYIPPKEAKVFVTKTKAPYLIAIELYDPLEIINEPLVLEPYQAAAAASPDHLPTPPPMVQSRSLKKMKTIKQIMPTQDILVLGTIPRNLVDPKLIAKKQQRKSLDEEDIITIEKSKRKSKVVTKVSIKDGTVTKCKEEEKKMVDLVPFKKRQSAIFPLDLIRSEQTPLSTEKDGKSSVIFPSRPSGENSSTNQVKPLEISIEPVLVVQNDIVRFFCVFPRKRMVLRNLKK